MNIPSSTPCSASKSMIFRNEILVTQSIPHDIYMFIDIDIDIYIYVYVFTQIHTHTHISRNMYV